MKLSYEKAQGTDAMADWKTAYGMTKMSNISVNGYSQTNKTKRRIGTRLVKDIVDLEVYTKRIQQEVHIYPNETKSPKHSDRARSTYTIIV